MKINLKKISLPLFAAMLLLNACKKNDTTELPASISPAVGEYVLSEGTFGGNNTKLAYYENSTATLSGDFFGQQNPTMAAAGLGDTGNDFIIYGGKMYIVMNNSGRVTVLNANNAAYINAVDFKPGAINKNPRYAFGTRGKVYVTAYDNTVSVIDTTTLAIINTIHVGANPEGIAASANYLYVANSGGLNYPNVDSTVSLIDLNTETEIRKIKVGFSPYKVQIAANGNVYVSAYGSPTKPASIFVINGSTNLTATDLGSSYQYNEVRIFNDIAYFYNNYGGTGTAKVYNTTTGSLTRNEFITDGTVIHTAYGINVDGQNGDVYIADAPSYTTPGSVTCFNSAGVKKFSFSVAPGENPNTILFKR